MRVRPFVPALVATALSLAPSALSLAPLGRVYAQDVDLGKICNQLRDPTFFPIDASGKYALPKGLEEQQRDQVFTVLRLRVHAYYMLRRAELNREAEAQLNIMEEIGLTEEPSPEAKAALDRIRKGLQADTQLDQKQAEAFGKQAADAFKTLCANIQPSSITLQPLPGLLPFIGVVIAPARPAPAFVWEGAGTGDCTGHDVGTSDGSKPDNAQAREGFTAVCWNGGNKNNPGKAFCTYKSLPPEKCTGGTNPGVKYRAARQR